MIQNICKNCGHLFEGKFCNNCGEKVYTDHDKSIRHLLDEGIHFFTHLDNKFFKTLVLLIRRPGQLSVSYCGGARNRYYQPLSFFFIGIVLYLLFGILQGLNMSFSVNITNFRGDMMSVITNLAHKKALTSHISMDELAERYDHKSSAVAKILLLFILPLTGLGLKILFPKKRKYFFDYLILATESGSMILYYLFLILPWIFQLLAITLQFLHVRLYSVGDFVIVPLYLLLLGFWIIQAFRNFFEISFSRALVKGFLFLLFQVVAIFIYRLVLFLLVLLLI